MQNDMFMRIAINSVRNDLLSRNEAFQCLALSFVGNGDPQSPFPETYMSVLVGGAEMAESLTPDVMKILVSQCQIPVW